MTLILRQYLVSNKFPDLSFPYFFTWFQVPVDDTTGMAMLDALQDLLNASRRVGLAVELARDDVLEQLAAGDQVEDEVVEALLLIKFSGFNKIWFTN